MVFTVKNGKYGQKRPKTITKNSILSKIVINVKKKNVKKWSKRSKRSKTLKKIKNKKLVKSNQYGQKQSIRSKTVINGQKRSKKINMV